MKKQTKESFLLYRPFFEPIKDFSNENLGILFRAIYIYQLTGELPGEGVPSEVAMAFKFFQNQFRLDDAKYEEFLKSQRAKGKSSAQSRSTKSTAVNHGQPNQPVSTYNENDNVKENVNDNEKGKDKGKIKYPYRALTKFKTNKTEVVARIKSLGYSEVENYFDRVVSYCETNANAKKYLDLEAVVIQWLSRDNKKTIAPTHREEIPAAPLIDLYKI